RLPEGSDPSEVGLDTYLDGAWLVAIEWPDRFAGSLGVGRVWDIRFESIDSSTRRIEIMAPGVPAC
ncbi:MAG: hypothetical protein ACKO5K_09290, partial [Armatimonadota bacterium]